MNVKSDVRVQGIAIEEMFEQIVRDFPYGFLEVSRNQIASWIGCLPFSQVLEADMACEAFISERRWPDMTRCIGEQIRVRLESVLALCKLGAVQSLEGMPEDEALQTLLIDFWHRKAIEWAEAVFGNQAG